MNNVKSTLGALLMVIIICGVALAGTGSFQTASASKDVIGIISSDTTWTKANGPYGLTGPVKVNNDVTLTIEAGATVNLNSYYIQVDGTLQAIGSSADQIHFNAGSITFTESSSDWNEQASSGCIIENALLNSVTISSSNNAIKLNHDSITGDIHVNGASIISSSTIVGTVITGDSTVVWKNTITGGITTGGLERTSVKYPIISSNIISGGTGFYKWGIQCFGYALIVDNTISDCNYGVYLYTQDTQFGGSIAPNAILERNKITGNTQGIHLEIYPARVYGSINPSIISNTISQNTIGIYIDGDSSKPILRNSNIQDNSNYNIQLKSSGNLNATYNWWGTTDTSSIDQTIFDSKRDFNLGTVNYTPYLTAPNTQATPDPNAPMPVPNSSISPSPLPSPSPEPEPTPSPSPDQSNTRGGTSWEFNGEVAVIAALIGVSVVLAIVLKKKQ